MKPLGTSIGTKLTIRAAIALVVALAGAAWCLATTPSADISSAGPLTHIWIGNELSCQVQHIADGGDYEFYGPDIFPADAGTFIAMGGVLYAPDFANHDYSAAESFIGTYTPFTPVSQTGVTGTGTAADPFKVITVVDAAATGLVIQQTDSYVVGEDNYHTDIMMCNTGLTTASGIVYRAADAFLGGSDTGYGFTEVFSGNRNAVGCSVNANNSPPGKIEEWIPSIGGNNYYQNEFDMVWSAIGSKMPFPDTCACTDNLDNGAGISWNFSIPAGGCATYSQVTGVSPQGLEGLVTSKTADSSTSQAGTQNGYTITIQNPNANAVTVSSITDTLPAGFVYVPGSTTGVTTNDPAIVAQMLTWSGSFTVPGEGSISLHFLVTVTATPGNYFNEAGGTAEGSYNVIGTGPTAQITVTAAPTPTPTATAAATATATPAATATATATFSPTPVPTATATSTPTPSATATATPTPTTVPTCQFPTSITANFNGTAIVMGNYIWFSSVLKPHGQPANQPVTIRFINQSITSSAFTLSVPDATVIFDPAASSATTTFVGGMPETRVPAAGLAGNTFFSALSYLVPVTIPGGLKNITWSGIISSDTPGVGVNWKWAAAVYSNFNADYSALGVKPVDDNKASQYKNSDHAGTPENFKLSVIGGATGGGGTNYTGGYSGTGSVGPCPR